MKTQRVSWLAVPLLAAALLCAPSAALALNPIIPGYNAAQIFQANTTVSFMSYSSGGGELRALKCIFPSSSPTTVKVLITTDAGMSGTEKDLSITVDPTFFHRESSGSGHPLSEWVPLNVQWFSTISVQLNNTGLGTSTVNCWVSWTTTNIE